MIAGLIVGRHMHLAKEAMALFTRVAGLSLGRRAPQDLWTRVDQPDAPAQGQHHAFLRWRVRLVSRSYDKVCPLAR